MGIHTSYEVLTVYPDGTRGGCFVVGDEKAFKQYALRCERVEMGATVELRECIGRLYVTFSTYQRPTSLLARQPW